jgi:hypothetical protein
MYDEFKDRIILNIYMDLCFLIYITFSKIVSELDPNIKALVTEWIEYPLLTSLPICFGRSIFHWKKRRTIGLQSQPSINIPESQVFNDGARF